MTRAFAAHELAARVWWELSPAFRAERAIAARAYRDHVTAGRFEADTLLQVVGEFALEGFHARVLFTRPVVDDRYRLVVAYAPMNIDTARDIRAIVTDLARALRMGRR